MRRGTLVGVVLGGAAALAGAPASATMDAMPAARVSIAFSAFAPEQIDVVAGDTVTWTNDSVRAHTVDGDDESYASDRMATGEAFSHQFTGPGEYPYHCRLHPFMRGEVDVYPLLLDRPQAPAGPGRGYPITGRAALPAGSRVDIQADAGGGFQTVGTTDVGPDGHFSIVVTPTTTARYRAVAGDQASPAVDLIVLDHTILATPSRRRGGGVVVSTLVTPAEPGAPVVLQLRLRDRFGWWPVARGRLGRDSRVRLFVRPSGRVPARVLLTLADGATPLAISPTFSVGSSRRRRG